MAIRFIRDQNEDEVPCYKHLNLLGHAQLAELSTGSECGGHGICGKDRIFVPFSSRSHLTAPTEIEVRHLGQKLVSEGWRLSCQVFPVEDDLEVTILLSR